LAGLPWFALWSDFPDHPKTVQLCAKLRDPNAGMYLVRLLGYCARLAHDGRIPGDVLEYAAAWRGKPGVFVSILVDVGFIEPAPGGLYLVHGWEERNGAHVRKRERDARKPRGNLPCPVVVPRGTAAGPPRETETETETETEEAEAASGGCLDAIREKLVVALGVPIGLGKNPDRTVASFRRWLDAGVEEDELVAECVRLAREKGVTPSSLAWWPGWLDTVSDAVLARPAARGRTGGA
jgi:hypothetical protein